MGWNSLIPGRRAPGDGRRPPGQIKQVIEAYRQKCLSTLFLYPTFRSSAVIMTMSAPRAIAGGVFRSSGFESKRPVARPPPKQRREAAFLAFWNTDATREAFLCQCSDEDLAALRLVCRDFARRAAPVLFETVTSTFRAGTFTRSARMAALERIGRHVRTLQFRLPHDNSTFLPPLLDPVDGKEQAFTYVPQKRCHNACASRPEDLKYGSWDMTELLVQQYGPLFHAATNIPSFIRALTAMKEIEHLKISCPGQEAAYRYRRSVVDYALISLRIAVETAPLTRLSTLSLLPIHPGAVLYLRPGLGFGGSPRSTRRWRQIKRMVIHMDGWERDGCCAPTDQLKLLRDYLSLFASDLERLSFRWRGGALISPLTLHAEPGSSAAKSKYGLPRLHFPRLRHLELGNCKMHAAQVSSLIGQHRRTLRECDFEDVTLLSGDWDGAFAVLTRLSGNERWKSQQAVGHSCRGSEHGRGGGDGWFGSPEHLQEFLRYSTVAAC